MNRNRIAFKLLLAGLGTLCATLVQAQLAIPGADGSDGDLTLTGYNEKRTIDLGLATTGSWDDPSDGNGIYDPSQWAVVFKYSSVTTTGSGTQEISFINHPSGAPVVWLVSGDVQMAEGDHIILDGQSQSNGQHAKPGPGGFWGGINPVSANLPTGAGFGPGGGQRNDTDNPYSGSGSYGSAGNYRAGPVYGNPRLLPLIGGSGGGGSTDGYGGAAGGGAILIAATGTVQLDGSIYARGGGGNYNWTSGLGSGGAVRIVADTITGIGTINALGGTGSNRPTRGGDGRIRLEAANFGGSINTLPLTYGVAPDDPVLLWPRDGAPTLEVVSIGGVSAPGAPYGSIYAGFSDVLLGDLASGDVVLASTNVDPAATVELRIIPKFGDPVIIPQVPHTSGDLSASTWTATGVELPPGIFTVQARAVNP
jgi:hypothetical protein